MSVQLNPYLSFRGNASQAMDFYHSVFGGELTRSTFGEFNASTDPAEKDLIMHSQLVTGDGLVLMVSDVPSHMEYQVGTNNFSVSLSGGTDDDARLRGYWEKLSSGGNVLASLEVAPWGDTFGMCVDQFGITWLVNISGQQAQG